MLNAADIENLRELAGTWRTGIMNSGKWVSGIVRSLTPTHIIIETPFGFKGIHTLVAL